MKMIYRGYDIEQTKKGWSVSKDGQHLETFKTKDAACSYIDRHKRSENHVTDH